MSKKWYHNAMLPWQAQAVIVFGCLLTLMFSMMTYEILEEDVVVFSGECIAEQYEDDEGNVTNELVAVCGDDHRVGLNSDQEMSVYYQELTTGVRPAIMCEKTVSEYLNNERWSCTVQTENGEDTA